MNTRNRLTTTVVVGLLTCAGAFAQTRCEDIRLTARLDSSASRAVLPIVSVKIENLGEAPIAIRRDKVASTLATQLLSDGKWEDVAGAGIGRGTPSTSAEPPRISEKELVKNALDEYVVLYAHEAFVARREMNPTDFGSARQPKNGRYRIVFEYFDDLAERAPVYRSTCKVSSNAVTITVK